MREGAREGARERENEGARKGRMREGGGRALREVRQYFTSGCCERGGV